MLLFQLAGERAGKYGPTTYKSQLTEPSLEQVGENLPYHCGVPLNQAGAAGKQLALGFQLLNKRGKGFTPVNSSWRSVTHGGNMFS